MTYIGVMSRSLLILLSIVLLPMMAKSEPPKKLLTALGLRESFTNQGYLGAGIGIPYGVIGINAEVALNSEGQDNLYLTGGAGILFSHGLAYSGGINLYLMDYDRLWRPRVSFLYGTNGIYQGYENHVYHGLNVGIGQLFQLGADRDVAISLDIVLIATSGLFDKLEEVGEQAEAFTIFGTPRLKFSLGIKRAF